jgi:Spy/CpxP family protein refolding chaperone
MNSKLFGAARVAALGLVCLLPAMAQGPMGPRGGRGGFGGPEGNPGFLAGYLGLTEAQKTQAQQIFESSKTQMEALEGEMEAAREALQAAVKAQKSDGELTQLATAVGASQGKAAAIQAQTQKRFRAILTAEQLTKIDSRPTRGPRP